MANRFKVFTGHGKDICVLVVLADGRLAVRAELTLKSDTELPLPCDLIGLICPRLLARRRRGEP